MGSDSLYTAQMFAQTMTTPAMISSLPLTPPPTVDPISTTIKMEDLTVPMSPTPSPSPSPEASDPSSVAPEGKSAKKRKSWGQVLPEPKTSLPPRKRAKTEDEKEQRRIERVKRNRLAAHNSRERKRQEVELLQQEKDQLEDDLKQARAAMARMAAKLKAFEQRHPGEAVVDDVSSPDEDYESLLSRSETICPRQASFPSPISMDSMDTPRDSSCQPETPAYSDSVATELDQTRYPAAVSSPDLLCQSSSPARSQRVSLQLILTSLILLLNLPSTTSLWRTSSASTRSPSTKAMSMWISLLTWLTTQTSSQLASSTLSSQTPSAFLTNLMQNPSICRQHLAQPLLATMLSLQRSSSNKWVARLAGRRGWAGQDVKERRRCSRFTRCRRRHGFSQTDFKRALSLLDMSK